MHIKHFEAKFYFVVLSISFSNFQISNKNYLLLKQLIDCASKYKLCLICKNIIPFRYDFEICIYCVCMAEMQGYSLPGTTEYVCLFVLVFTLFCSFLKQGNPRVKGGKALGCIYKGLWTLGVEKGSAVHRREELGSRTDTTYLRFVFVFFTYCGTSIGYWLPFTSALAPRCSYEGWWALPDSMLRTLRLYDSMLVCEYIDMYDRERMGDVLLPM